ncbi:MAG TPA: M20 family peptidase [Candidatus Limnocylindrales bacterium]|nr:M20 family peptidase [Candidatus Limnocylindrales bacterium]
MKRLFLALFILVALMGAILIVRAATFASRQIHTAPAADFKLNRQAALQRLSEAIQLPTVSLQSPSRAGAQEFLRFHDLLAKSFPGIHSQLTRETVNDYSLLYTWKGQDAGLKPILLMGHIDVVPVDPDSEKYWTYPPFSGKIVGGYIWGRGSIDDKVNVIGMLEAVEYLLARGFQPQRTIYLALGHDEESGGQQGAAKIAALLSERGVQLEFLLDEGSAIIDGIIPGVAAPVAMIGIGEKGYLTLRLTVSSPGGHSSLPPSESAIGILSRAIDKVERTRFPKHINDAVKEFFNYVGPELPWDKKLVLANLWLTDPWLERELAKSPLTDSMIRTTKATTIFQAGDKENVLPARAQAVINFRLISGDTVEAVIARVRQVIDDGRVQITPLPDYTEPSPISSVDAEGFKIVHRTVSQVAPRAIVAPFLTIAATDTRYYAKLTKDIYRFVPIVFRPEDTQRIHGVDERISIEDYERCVRFYAQLIRNSQ